MLRVLRDSSRICCSAEILASLEPKVLINEKIAEVRTGTLRYSALNETKTIDGCARALKHS